MGSLSNSTTRISIVVGSWNAGCITTLRGWDTCILEVANSSQVSILSLGHDNENGRSCPRIGHDNSGHTSLQSSHVVANRLARDKLDVARKIPCDSIAAACGRNHRNLMDRPGVGEPKRCPGHQRFADGNPRNRIQRSTVHSLLLLEDNHIVHQVFNGQGRLYDGLLDGLLRHLFYFVEIFQTKTQRCSRATFQA